LPNDDFSTFISAPFPEFDFGGFANAVSGALPDAVSDCVSVFVDTVICATETGRDVTDCPGVVETVVGVGPSAMGGEFAAAVVDASRGEQPRQQATQKTSNEPEARMRFGIDHLRYCEQDRTRLMCLQKACVL
jgi:hypothetical protein